MITGLEYNTIHVGCREEPLHHITDLAVASGAKVFNLSLNGVSSRDDLVRRFVDTFHIPWPISGLDAVLSTGAALDWLTGERSFVVAVDGIDSVPANVLRDTVAVLLNIVDRMRSAGDRYMALFADAERTCELVEMLERENHDLRELERIDPGSDTHPVPVVDHRDDPQMAP